MNYRRFLVKNRPINIIYEYIFRQDVVNFFSILRCSVGQLFSLHGPDFGRGPLIEDPCSSVFVNKILNIGLNMLQYRPR